MSPPTHIALKHRIPNSPNPGLPGTRQPIPGSAAGEEATVVHLGAPIAYQQPPTPQWWPDALTDEVRRKLFRRIHWEGYALHTHLAVTFALLHRLYTAPDGPRLKYRSSPVADFGLATGRFRAIEDDRLAYVLPDGKVIRGQDPGSHTWIYFRTTRGEGEAGSSH